VRQRGVLPDPAGPSDRAGLRVDGTRGGYEGDVVLLP
jgi:hypothetical protein